MRKFAILTFVLMSMNVLAITSDTSSKWGVSRSQDDFTDKKMTTAYITAKGGVNDGYIMLSCYEDDFEGKISAGEYVGEYDVRIGNVKYRIDSNVPVLIEMTPYKKMVYFSDINHSFVKALVEGDTSVVVQIMNHDFDTDKIRFPLKGSTEAIGEVLSACNKLLRSSGDY